MKDLRCCRDDLTLQFYLKGGKLLHPTNLILNTNFIHNFTLYLCFKKFAAFKPYSETPCSVLSSKEEPGTERVLASLTFQTCSVLISPPRAGSQHTSHPNLYIFCKHERFNINLAKLEIDFAFSFCFQGLISFFTIKIFLKMLGRENNVGGGGDHPYSLARYHYYYSSESYIFIIENIIITLFF